MIIAIKLGAKKTIANYVPVLRGKEREKRKKKKKRCYLGKYHKIQS